MPRFETDLPIGQTESDISTMAKPGIPIEIPRRRAIPYIPDPFPAPVRQPMPFSVPNAPVTIPKVPVPAGITLPRNYHE